jgi:hypothetical protein
MKHGDVVTPPMYGLMAAFDEPEAVLEATQKAHGAGYRKLEAYTPFPVEGLNEALGYRYTRLPLIVLCGALAGGIGGFLMQYWMSAIDYPLNIGGRPYFSWPAFIPPTFEMTILLGAFSAVIGMLALNGLPMPYHPVFNVPQFRQASRDSFFLVIESSDPKFDGADTRQFLESLNPRGVYEVER